MRSDSLVIRTVKTILRHGKLANFRIKQEDGN